MILPWSLLLCTNFLWMNHSAVPYLKLLASRSWCLACWPVSYVRNFLSSFLCDWDGYLWAGQPVPLDFPQNSSARLKLFRCFMFLQQAMACFRFSPAFFVLINKALMLFTAAFASPFDTGLCAEGSLWEMLCNSQNGVNACLNCRLPSELIFFGNPYFSKKATKLSQSDVQCWPVDFCCPCVSKVVVHCY